MCKPVTTIEYNGNKIELYESDLNLIACLREVGFGRILDIKVQDGRAKMVEKCKLIQQVKM